MKTLLLAAVMHLWSCGGQTITAAAPPKQHSVDLTWTAPAVPPSFSGYYVYRAKQGSSFTKLTSNPIIGTHFHDGTVAKKTTYLYYVTAVNSVGESAHSNIFTAQIPNP